MQGVLAYLLTCLLDLLTSSLEYEQTLLCIFIFSFLFMGCCSDMGNTDGFALGKVSGHAPGFTANSYFKGEFREVSLHEYLHQGKWVVLFFYPLDFTFVCPTEIQEFSRKAKEFEKEGAQILGISVDSEYSHKAWCKGDLGDLEFPLISDFTKEISMMYGVLHADGMSLRGTFIIDPSGIIHHATINNLPLGRNVDETLRILQGAKTGHLCPVGWKKVEKTLGKAQEILNFEF